MWFYFRLVAENGREKKMLYAKNWAERVCGIFLFNELLNRKHHIFPLLGVPVQRQGKMYFIAPYKLKFACFDIIFSAFFSTDSYKMILKRWTVFQCFLSLFSSYLLFFDCQRNFDKMSHTILLLFNICKCVCLRMFYRTKRTQGKK